MVYYFKWNGNNSYLSILTVNHVLPIEVLSYNILYTSSYVVITGALLK
nr:MAG TPA: hypothetical protein [Caudoviricetes sp.]